MGLDLALVPCLQNIRPLAYSRLGWLVRNYELFATLRESSILLNDSLSWYSDERIETRSTDPYGEPLTYLPAAILAPYLDSYASCGWDRGIGAFIGALEPDTQVILWWY